MHQEQPQRVAHQADPIEEAITATKPAVVKTTEDARTWKQALVEIMLRDAVDEDSDMYDDIEKLPDDDNMVAQIIAMISKSRV